MTVIDVIQQQTIQAETAESLDPRTNSLRGFSQTAPQVGMMVSPSDGQLDRPSGQGQIYYQLARAIRLDPTVRLVRDLVMAPLMRAGWQYECNDKAPHDAVELVKKQIEPLRLKLLRTSQSGMIDYGYSPYEVWPDGSWNLKIKPLYVDYTTILVNAADGEFWGLRQQPRYSTVSTSYVYLKRSECFIVTQDIEAQNYYGNATLRSLTEVYSENQAINLSSRKYDTKIAGTHWVIYYPLGKSKFDGVEMDNGAIAKVLLAKAESVGGIMVPRSIVQALDTMSLQAASNEATQWKIELLSDKGAGQMAFENKLKYLDVLKVRAFGMPERAILEGQYGTKAEAESHADIAVANLEVRHQMLVDVYNQELVNKILTWHCGPEYRDTVWIKPIPIDDLALTFNRQLYMQLLTDPSVKANELTHIDMGALRDGLGVPEIEHDEDVETDDWLSDLGIVDNDFMSTLGLSKPLALAGFDPNQPRDNAGQWATSKSEQINSPAFKKWFGKSKIVDSEGKPRVVYHGTTGQFTEFNPGHNEKFMLDRMLGVHLANDLVISEKFTDKDGGHIKPVYLRLENPKIINQNKRGFDQTAINEDILSTVMPDNKKLFVDWVQKSRNVSQKVGEEIFDRLKKGDSIGENEYNKVAGFSGKDVGAYMANFDSGLFMLGEKERIDLVKQYKTKLQSQGYDGLQYQNTSPRETEGATDKTNYIAFNANQIKSATGNSGAFDPESNDIRLSTLALGGFDPNQPRSQNNGRWTKTPGYPRDIFFRSENGNRYVIQQMGADSFQVIDSNDIQIGTEYASLKEAQEFAENHSNPPAQPYFPDNWRDTAQTAEYYGSTITQMPDGNFEVMTANGNVYIRPTLDTAMGAADQHLRGVSPEERVGPARHVYQQMRGDSPSSDSENNYKGWTITRDDQGRYVSTSPRGYSETHNNMADLRRQVDMVMAPPEPNTNTYRGHVISTVPDGRQMVVEPNGFTTYHNNQLAAEQYVNSLTGPADDWRAQRRAASSELPPGDRDGEGQESSNLEKHSLAGKEITVRRADDVTTADIRKANPNLTLARVVSLVGPQAGAEVTVYKPSPGDNHITVDIDHPDYTASRKIFDDGTIKNEIFKKKKGSTAKGIGVSVVHDQVKSAVKLGFKKLKLYAAGQGTGTHELNQDGDYNGYYTWPRMGYDGKLENRYHPELQSHIDKTKAVNVSDLMRNELGRYLWQKHGRGMDMVFDLSKGSKSRKMLSAYYKAIKGK